MSETTSSRRRFLRQSGIGAVATLCGGCKVLIGNRATDLRVAPQSGMVRVPLSDAKVLNEPGGQMVVAIAGEPTKRSPRSRTDADVLVCDSTSEGGSMPFGLQKIEHASADFVFLFTLCNASS